MIGEGGDIMISKFTKLYSSKHKHECWSVKTHLFPPFLLLVWRESHLDEMSPVCATGVGM